MKQHGSVPTAAKQLIVPATVLPPPQQQCGPTGEAEIKAATDGPLGRQVRTTGIIKQQLIVPWADRWGWGL